MPVYPFGVEVQTSLPLRDLNGDVIEPISISLSIYDQDDWKLYGPVNVPFTPGAPEVLVTVPSSVNEQRGEVLESRQLVLTVQVPMGSIQIADSYMLKADRQIVPLKNSFQTYERAKLVAAQLTNMLSWMGATDDDRMNALSEAYTRLTKLGYRVRTDEEIDHFNYIPDITENLSPRRWNTMSLSDWERFPEHFRAALCKAQVVEANEILSGVDPASRRRMGVLSESIGESSMMFRSGKPVDLGISARALGFLAGYVQIRVTITRT